MVKSRKDGNLTNRFSVKSLCEREPSNRKQLRN